MKYHGRGRKQHLADIGQFEIVITTYNTIAREYGIEQDRGHPSPLHGVEWYRVVLDEGNLESDRSFKTYSTNDR